MGIKKEYYCDLCQMNCAIEDLFGIQLSSNQDGYHLFRVDDALVENAEYYLCIMCAKSIAKIFSDHSC